MSRIEKILQAMIDETSYNEAPQSRIEAILLAIKNNTQYSHLPHSRIEEILLAIKNNTSYDKEPMSRIEEILLAKLNSVEYKKPVQSKIEKLLLKWLYQDLYLTLKGVPPLTFTANGQPLVDWTIYGNTVDGESVGDRTGNLFDKDTMVNGITDAYINFDGTIIYSQSWIVTPYIPCNSNVITLTFDISIGNYPSICLYDENKNYITGAAYRSSRTIAVTTEYVAKYIRFSYTIYTDLSKIMLNSGSTPLPYEPYGYKVPVTVSNGTDTQTIPIYLTEQIKKVGDEAEYISYSDQKMHRIGADDVDVTLPALPTIKGTNTLTVGTEVQPSNVEIIYTPKEPELKLMMKKKLR